MIKMVKMVGTNISDQQRALDFYTEKLGFEVHTDQPMGDGCGKTPSSSAMSNFHRSLGLPSRRSNGPISRQTTSAPGVVNQSRSALIKPSVVGPRAMTTTSTSLVASSSSSSL